MKHQHRWLLKIGNKTCDPQSLVFVLGESYVDCCERLVPFLERFEDECRSGSTAPLLIVAHQAILRCIFGYLLDTDITEIPFIKIPQVRQLALGRAKPSNG